MPLPLHLPRRHRRPLLFPPGLLALAWLLWLGCVALPQMRGMGRERVMQLTLAPLQIPYYGVLGTNLIGKEPYFSSLELAAFRPWQEVRFTGNLWNDYFAHKQVQSIVKQMQAEPDYDRGLCVQFESHISYASLVRTLDMLNMYDTKNSWLDIRQSPVTLHAFTSKPIPVATSIEAEPLDIISCGYIPSEPTKQELLIKHFASLFQPDWRNSTLLLLLMALLSAVRLGRRWRLG
ncbi:hypothetical protein KBK19_10000 [Microvirga sp. STR05]|uniref:Uncharacterized protein n=1 Tax=Hymenobacter duratus TaxID=2771356 RepID=A0ABR8JJ17_9BACT|nr:hypothetical protein [Hymenobacter duratus]MBD2715367.1 hypothetical protein [Hymenobacter duratus]MBR7950274.1 hypothetical protein [Microvirga sp. STR05]